MNAYVLSYVLALCLAILSITSIPIWLILAGTVLWHYRRSRIGSFRWYLRNLHLKHLAAIACLFFLAMAASYGLLQEAWALVYLVLAFQTGAWWLRLAINQRA